MLDLSIEINGKKVGPNSIEDAIEAEVLKEIQDSVKKTASSIRCSKQGKGAKIIVKGRSVDDLSLKVSGCCEELVEKVIKECQGSLKRDTSSTRHEVHTKRPRNAIKGIKPLQSLKGITRRNKLG